MKEAVFVFVVIVAACIQSTLLEGIKVLGVKPDLLFLAMFVAAVSFDRSWALFIAVVCGLLKDLLGTSAVALNTVLLPAASFALIQAGRRISLDNYIVAAGAVFVVLTVYDIVSQVVLGLFSMRVLALQPVYTAAVFLLLSNRLLPLVRR